MLTQTYITLITAFGGIVLGFFVGQVSDYLRANREDRRVLKEVLFNQLDIWFESRKADVDTLVPMILERLRAGFHRLGVPSEQLDSLFSISSGPLIQLFEDVRIAHPEALKERYEKSISQLARVDPLLAFELSGRPQVDLNETIDEFISRATELDNESGESNETTVTFFRTFLKGYGQRKQLTGMETDIVEVAKRLGFVTARQTRQIIVEAKSKLPAGVDAYIDDYLRALVEHVTHVNLKSDA